VPFFDTSVELFRKVLDINLIGTFTVAREAGRLMRAHGGAIVNIASIPASAAISAGQPMERPRVASSR